MDHRLYARVPVAPHTGLIAAGIRFMAAPGGFTSQVAAFVREWGKYDGLGDRLDGMPA